MRVADFAFDFRFRRQCRHGVNDDNVYCARTRQGVTDFQCLLAGVRLGAQQVIDIDAQFTCIDWVQRVFSIDKRTSFTFALGCGDHLQRQRGFTGRFRSVDFDDTAHRQTTCPKRDIQ